MNAPVAELLLAILRAEEVIASWVAVPAVMVSVCVSEVRPVAAAVMVGNPATVSA